MNLSRKCWSRSGPNFENKPHNVTKVWLLVLVKGPPNIFTFWKSSVSSALWHVASSYWNKIFPTSSSSIFVLLIFLEKLSNFPLGQNPLQTVARSWYIGLMRACGFSVPQMWQYCWFIYKADGVSLLLKFRYSK